MAGSSLTGRRINVDFMDGRMGVLPTKSWAGDALPVIASRCPLRDTVDGTKGPMLEGGMKSSNVSCGLFDASSDLTPNTFLNRWFAGVAFTCTCAPRELLAGFFISVMPVSITQIRCCLSELTLC